MAEKTGLDLLCKSLAYGTMMIPGGVLFAAAIGNAIELGSAILESKMSENAGCQEISRYIDIVDAIKL